MPKTTISIPSRDGYTDGPYVYRREMGDKAAAWFGKNLRLPEDPHAGQAFVLAEWQANFVRALEGWRHTDDESRRRYTTSWLEVGRSNGKTAFESGWGIKGLQGERRRTPSVVCAATDKNIAGTIFKYASRMVLFNPQLKAKLNIKASTKHLVRKDGTGNLFVISADGNRAHSYHPTTILLDEVHTLTDRELYDVLSTSQASVDNPLFAMSTTAGFDRTTICWELHEKALAVVADPSIDPTMLVDIHSIDEGDDIEDPKVWRKSNPNLGVTVSEDFIRRKVQEAKRSPADMNKVLRLHFNVWTSTETAWILDQDWMACASSSVDLKGRLCYGGLDLGYTDDLSAFALFFPAQGAEPAHVRVWYWLPEAAIAKRRWKVPYDLWISRGLIRPTKGEASDFAQIEADIVALSHQYNILEIGYDEWSAKQMAQNLDGQSLNMIALRQGFADMSFPVEQLESLVHNRRILHDGNEVLRWNVGNVLMDQDPGGHLRPVKKKSKEKIDGLVAVLMAVRQGTLQESLFVGGLSVG